MIPTAKHLNFYDDSIGSIHTIKFSGLALHRLIERCSYRRLSDDGVKLFSSPTYEGNFRKMRKSGKVGAEKPFYDEL